MRVNMVGVSGRLSLGVRRYLKDLLAGLNAKGVTTGFDLIEPDITHAISPVLFPKGKNFVVTFHDLGPISRWNAEVVDYGSLRARAYSAWFKADVTRSFEHAKRIIAGSSQALEEVRQFFPQHFEKTRMINPGLSERFHPVNREENGTRVIGYYREMHPMMRRMLSLLRLNKVGFQLCKLENIPDKRLVDYYGSLDYFVDLMPYRGFGYPLVEAAACGATIVTRKDAHIPEEVKRLGIEIEDAEDAALTITRRERMRPVLTPFKLERMVDATLKLYQDLTALRMSKG